MIPYNRTVSDRNRFPFSAQSWKYLFNFVFIFAVLHFAFFIDTSAKTKYSGKNAGQTFIRMEKTNGGFTLSESGKTAPLYISTSDYEGVIRAVNDLQSDLEKVTGAKPVIEKDKIPDANEPVIIGTLGKSYLIDLLVKNHKINDKAINGKWESFLIQVVNNPFPNVKRALIVAGSDKRGTIYGIYDISEKIGVSPWYYWADVPVKKHNDLYVIPGIFNEGPPAVKYRGIFLNDEAPALSGWVNEKFGGYNHKFYEHVFELILRLKGNYLWPAMWNNMFNVDDTLNPKLANEYGIVMGTSHHEPMMRAWKEWQKFGHGDWNYQTNDSVLNAFWSEGIKRMDNYESIVTIGMRGNGDEPMSKTDNIGLLERIVNDQRGIIKKVTGKDPSEVPQVWALYKEVQDYYDKGMRVPDDVTLLFSDDNWGNIRRLPELNAKSRKGGYGIYYHYDYVGGPRNYKWLNTNQIERVWEQMHLAYKYGAKQIWIVNVGDLKPMEFPINFFMDYAWNPDRYSAGNLPEYYKSWAEKQFGPKYAEKIGYIIAEYTKFNARRKPELLSPDTYSLTNYNEANSVVESYNKLASDAKQIYDAIPLNYKPAFYQLVLYPVLACANLNDLYVTAGLNHLYANQGRAATDSLALRVKKLFERDAEYSHYYNKVMEDGRWDHMMDQTHIGYTYWQQPDSNIMPEVKEIKLSDVADMGVSVECSPGWWPKNSGEASLPEFDPFNRQSYYIEVFNRGNKPFNYSLKASEPWIKISAAKGTVNKQTKIWISVDWTKAPLGSSEIPLKLNGPNGSELNIKTFINNPVNLRLGKVSGFVESNGYVSINAIHYSKAIANKPFKWLIIPNLGRTNSAITSLPVTSPPQNPGGKTPHLEYRVFLFDTGEVDVKVYLSPTLDFNNTKGLRYAVSFDNQTPQIINMHKGETNRLWEQWVSNNINITDSKHLISSVGEHVLKFWLVDPGIDLQKIVINAGGEKESYLGPPESFHQNVNNISAGKFKLKTN